LFKAKAQVIFRAFLAGMAFEEEIVRDVMRRNIERHGAGYQSAAALLDAVVEFQE